MGQWASTKMSDSLQEKEGYVGKEKKHIAEKKTLRTFIGVN